MNGRRRQPSEGGPAPGFPVSVLALIGVATVILSCDDASTAPAPAPVATTVTVTPASAMLTAFGETVRFAAEVRDQHGRAMAGAPVAWSMSDPSVSSIDVSGVVTAAGNGTATLTATSGEASGSATVTVAQVAAEVTVAVVADTLLPGDTLRLTAVATDANGHPIASAGFAWSSSDTLVATVDTSGLVTARGSGESVLSAALDGVEGQARITVESRFEARFAEDSVRVLEGSMTEIAIRYEVRELAEAVRVELTAHEMGAEAADYELDPSTIEIPAGQRMHGMHSVWLRAARDAWISEGEEALALGLQIPEGLAADPGPDLEIVIVEGGASPCAGVTVHAESPELLAAGPPWTIPTALFGDARIVGTTLAMEFHPEAAQTLFDWVGPYRNAPREGEWGISRWWRNRWHSVPEFSVAFWEVEQAGVATRHSIRVEWPADTESVLRFRSTGGSCEGEPRVVCGEDGCVLVPSRAP